MSSPTLTQQACEHCGEPAVFIADDLPFCCMGCRNAYAWLQDAGLSQYYQVRKDMEQGNSPALDQRQSKDYTHLDDDNFLTSLGHKPGACHLHVVGMHCAACVWLVEQLPTAIEGLQQTRADLAAGRVYFQWDPTRVKLSQVAATLEKLGYSVHASDEAALAANRKRRRRELARLTIAGASAGNTMLVAIALYAGELSEMQSQFRDFFANASVFLALPAVTYGAWPFYQAAWNNLRRGRLHLDLPISIGVIGAYLFSVVSLLTKGHSLYFDSVATLVFLLLVGRFIQQRGQQWALSKIGALHLLLPPTAYKKVASSSADAPTSQTPATIAVSSLALTLGDVVVVQAGQRIPADGLVTAGTSHVDASTLSGEVAPLPLSPGASALAGTKNLDATLEIRVQAVGEQTRIGSLSRQLAQSQGEKSAIEGLVDAISRRFVLAVFCAALIGGLLWWSLDPSRIFEVVLSILVVTCPCALGMATPLALARARAQAAQHGFILSRAAALEDLAHVNTFAFDKTGTLTAGRLVVQDVFCNLPQSELAAIVATLEANSPHPIARCLLKWTRAQLDAAIDQPSLVADATGVETSARGVSGEISGTYYRLGSFDDAEFDKHFAAFPAREAAEKARQAGSTVVYLEDHTQVIAAIALADELRPGVIEVVAQLQREHLACLIVSGDHPETVAALAARVGIAKAYGGLLPEDKLALLSHYPRVAMIGDGVNDAPALQAASVGIAMGGSAEIAMRVADIFVPSTSLSALEALRRGAIASLAVIRRNLVFALSYNLLCTGLALAGLITPLIAAILMPLSSLTVITMSMLARPFGKMPKLERAGTSATAHDDAQDSQLLQASDLPTA